MASWAEHLTADLSSALCVDVVEERVPTRELHICVRPAESKRSTLPRLDEVAGVVLPSRESRHEARGFGGLSTTMLARMVSGMVLSS